MLKIFIFMLYFLAVLTGVAGLIAGGVPLVNYALERWRDPEFDYYSNFGLVSTAGNIITLSLMLLIFVHVSYVIQRGFRATPKKPESPGRLQLNSSLSPDPISPPVEPQKKQPAAETPDEKLARLIDVKNK